MTTKTTTPLDVAAIRARADAATPGPWFVEEVEDGESCPDGSGSVNGYVESGAICSPPESDEDPPIIADDVYHAGNRVFISHARADVPELCDALEAALAEVALLRARLRKTAQILIEEVGAAGPANADEVAEKAAADIRMLRAVVDALPRCVDCESYAMARYHDLSYCDAHAPAGSIDISHAAALRALLAWGER